MTEAQETAQQRTLQQERAKYAWDQIQNIDEKYGNDQKPKKEYGSRVRSLPSLIQSDGLGQAVAFLRAADGRSKDKGNTTYIAAYNHLVAWLSQKFPVQSKSGDFIEWLIDQETSIYRRVTNEALAYLVWLKRFAEAKGWQDDDKNSEGN
jgi:CRISPR-associated protein Cmr5